MFTVDLTSQVTPYKQDNPNWGGAACCQMAMDGYPSGATSCYVQQSTIWNSIQANNVEPGIGPWGIGWYADPIGVTKTLNTLCPPQHVWVDASGSDKNQVLYRLLRYMANYKYASLICLWAHDYWNTMVYYETSDDPRTVTNPVLNWIGYYEPATKNYKLVDGPTWMKGPYYWALPCDGGQKWDNKWVGIGEPPEVDGAAQTEDVVRTGDRLIAREQAVNIARKMLADELRARRIEFLQRRFGLRPGNAAVVRELAPIRRPDEAPKEKPAVRYYLVPFGEKHEVDETGAAANRVAVLVNAYTGRVEELTIFNTPMRYLEAKEASAIVGRSLGLSRREVSALKPELVARPHISLVSAAVPAWSVTVAGRTVYVAQSGQVLGNLIYPTLRGA